MDAILRMDIEQTSDGAVYVISRQPAMGPVVMGAPVAIFATRSEVDAIAFVALVRGDVDDRDARSMMEPNEYGAQTIVPMDDR